jgi:5-hydroxyisourate hydrolase
MSAITTHVLDTSLGKPAANVGVQLERASGQSWSPCGAGVTDADGRARELLEGALMAGVYRIAFDTAEYFMATGRKCFYPRVEITFEVADATQHYHVPLLVSPYGYSTYRGS